MIKRLAFIATMKKLGYVYQTKEKYLYKSEFDNDPSMEVVIWLKTDWNGKEYANVRVQGKDHSASGGSPHMGRQDFVPYDYVVSLLALIKAVRQSWRDES